MLLSSGEATLMTTMFLGPYGGNPCNFQENALLLFCPSLCFEFAAISNYCLSWFNLKKIIEL